MLNSFLQFHDHLPLFAKWLFDFIFEIIFIRGIIAPKIVSDIEHTGFKKINIIHDMVHVFNLFVPNKESRSAIWQHWKAQARGEGHDADSIENCREQSCAAFLARA
jgi:hypothetical protein